MPGTGRRRSPRAPGVIHREQRRRREHPGDTASITASPRTRNARFWALMVSDATMLILSVAQHADGTNSRPAGGLGSDVRPHSLALESAASVTVPPR